MCARWPESSITCNGQPTRRLGRLRDTKRNDSVVSAPQQRCRPFLVTGTRALLGLGDLLAAQHWAEEVSAALLRGGIPGTLPAVEHARGLLALARGSTRSAGDSLILARAGWSSRGRTWEAAAALVDLAQCALRANREAEAVRTAKAAIAEAETLGAVPLQRRAERVLDLAQQRGGADEPWAPLSAREFQVAKLLAAGMTNRQIAGELRIAPKTVAAHVAHILTRLDAARRTEIAAWVASVPRAGSL